MARKGLGLDVQTIVVLVLLLIIGVGLYALFISPIGDIGLDILSQIAGTGGALLGGVTSAADGLGSFLGDSVEENTGNPFGHDPSGGDECPSFTWKRLETAPSSVRLDFCGGTIDSESVSADDIVVQTAENGEVDVTGVQEASDNYVVWETDPNSVEGGGLVGGGQVDLGWELTVELTGEISSEGGASITSGTCTATTGDEPATCDVVSGG